MSFFKMDESTIKTGGGAIKEGDYEVIITTAVPKLSSTNKNMIVVDYEVRSDVDQEYQGWKLRFNNFIIERSNGFTNKLLYACGWSEKEGNPPNFTDLADMAQQLVGKTLVVTVEHEDYVDNEGSTRKRGKAKFTSRSKLSQPVSSDDPFANSKGPIEVSEDDLPF